MPRHYLMTWQADKARWRKLHKGVLYLVSCRELGTPTTKEDSYQAANDWWASRFAALQTRRFQLREEDQLIPVAQHSFSAVDSGTVARITAAPSNGQSKTVAQHLKQWADLQLASNKSLTRKKMNVHMAMFFGRFMGSEATVDEIDEQKWVDFFHFLTRQKFASDYRARIQATAKAFLKNLYGMRLIELPRNLDDRLLRFEKTTKEVKVLPTETIKAFLKLAKGQTELHALLMLNCGMTAKDVSDLRADQVDWKEGTITRKRSKRANDPKAPKVTYKLWPKVFTLLKQYRAKGDIVLLTTKGQRWLQEHAENNSRSDSIRSNFRNIKDKHGVNVSPKQLRTAGASKLGEHPGFKFYAQYYLAQRPETVADKHYVMPSEKEFFEALGWLEKQFINSETARD